MTSRMMYKNKSVLVNFARGFVASVSAIFMLQLAGCYQAAQDADSFFNGQSVPSTEKPVETLGASTANLDSFSQMPQKRPTVQPSGPTLGIDSETVISSAYANQQTRNIKALSPEDIAGLRAGAGTPFGGMAKLAELHSYPGPRHVLDAVEAGELEVTDQQLEQINALYQAMKSNAIEIGEEIIQLETGVDDAFTSRTITNELLPEMVLESGRLYGRLRLVHLETHLSMSEILAPHQVEQYNRLRGNISGDPCENIPKGHAAELWKKHNNCD